MFRNGIYKIDYRDARGSSSAYDDALVVCRDGQIIGADRYGGIYTGRSKRPLRQASDATEAIVLQLTVPPGGELVNGISAGPDGASINITCRFDPTVAHQSSTIDVGGAPVEVVVSYLGPLPE